MHLANYLSFLERAEDTLADAFETVANGHDRDAGVHFVALSLAGACRTLAGSLRPVCVRFGPMREDDTERLHPDPVPGVRSGEVGLVRDLQDLYVLASLVDVTWMIVGQAAKGLRDRELMALADDGRQQTTGHLAWLRGQLSSLSPQALIAT